MPAKREEAMEFYAIFRIDNPQVPDLEILMQCLDQIAIPAVGLVRSQNFVADWGACHVDDLILKVVTKNTTDNGIIAAAATYITKQIANWEDDSSMAGWYRYDKWTRLKSFKSME